MQFTLAIQRKMQLKVNLGFGIQRAYSKTTPFKILRVFCDRFEIDDRLRYLIET